MKRMVVASLALAATTIAFAPPAAAKLCVRIDAPRSARIGSIVVVRVTTLLPTWNGRRLVDLQPTSEGRRLQLVAQSADGVYREVRLRRTADAAVWETTLRFRRSGFWFLTVAGWEYAPRACAPAIRIRVNGTVETHRPAGSRFELHATNHLSFVALGIEARSHALVRQ